VVPPPGAWVITDANGAFQLPTGKSVDPMRWVRASKAGYAQPCAAPIIGNARMNVQLVSRSALTGAPLPSPDGLRTVSGVVIWQGQSPVPREPVLRKGRPGLLPPLGVDFDTALGALLKTPPPPKGEATDKPKARKRKAGTEKAAPSKRKQP
jgi:hypothetical protein